MNQALDNKNIAFVGAGAMAEAIIRGLVQQPGITPEQIFATSRSNAARLAELTAKYGIRASNDPDAKAAAIREADIVVIAFKPKDAAEGLKQIRDVLSPRQLLVSVIAGLSIETIARQVPAGMPIVRTMPNTSSSIGLGVTGIAFPDGISEQDKAAALAMFRAVGDVYEVPEHQINWIVGLSGSGPAYVYYFIEAMVEAGIRGGLSPQMAKELVVQTVLGAANMVKQTGAEPAELRKQVTSPAGTTEAAIRTLTERRFQEAMLDAINRCVERAEEIGRLLDESITQDQ